MTLFLAEGAVILGVQDEKLWPLLPPLPSYGYGREHRASLWEFDSRTKSEGCWSLQVMAGCDFVEFAACHI
ncbi:unnamed protein product [Rhodiola kirilowii]